jgi:ABC-type antimicrobial peptide transport system permease subunit
VPEELELEPTQETTSYTLSALMGLFGGAIFGALIGTLYALFGLRGAQAWNDTGTITGGRDETGLLTLAQTLTLVFGIGGALLGGACGLITGLVLAFRRGRRRS